MKNLLFVFLVLLGFGVQAQSDLTLEDIFLQYKYNPSYMRGLRTTADGAHYTVLEKNSESGAYEINKYSLVSGNKVETVLSESELEGITIQEYSFSADEKLALVFNSFESIYRYSTREYAFVVDLKTKKVTPIGTEKCRYATFSPQGDKVAYVRANNLYYYDLTTNSETQVTSDGVQNQIINGATDWVYEEEFAFDKAFFWSPNGTNLAYYRFNETKVPEFNMPLYGTLYPQDNPFKYPKAGEENSDVSIHVYNTKLNNHTNLVQTNKPVVEYFPRIKWSAQDNMLAVLSMNRLQNSLDITLYNSDSGYGSVIYQEKADAYIEINDDLTFTSDNKSFILTSEMSGYNHIYKYRLDGALEEQITSGNWDVTKFLGYDEKAKAYYFESAEVSPLERNVYTIQKGKKSILTPQAGTNHATFTSNYKYFINSFSSSTNPGDYELFDSKGKSIRVLKDNTELQTELKQVLTSPKQFIKVPAADGTELNAFMIRPVDFNAKKKYPVLMYVYGGPGSQTVANSWDRYALWYQYLANQGYIVVSVDNRGTGARGRDFRTSTYKQLGNLETQDQISAATWLANREYVDENRIGIWGWSYGGYMSTLCISKGAETFKTAIAVAPVTNWKFYDSIYTERYMQTPQENNSGYADNSPINHVGKIKGNYLLVHGTADDNVHFQNAVELVSELNNNLIQYDFAMYPNKNHGIYGGTTRYHLFTKITDFVLNNL